MSVPGRTPATAEKRADLLPSCQGTGELRVQPWQLVFRISPLVIKAFILIKKIPGKIKKKKKEREKDKTQQMSFLVCNQHRWVRRSLEGLSPPGTFIFLHPPRLSPHTARHHRAVPHPRRAAPTRPGSRDFSLIPLCRGQTAPGGAVPVFSVSAALAPEPALV